MSKPRGRQRKKTPATLGVEPLQGRNVLLHGRQRTSMRLEPSMWSALEEIAMREGLSINDLCSQIDLRLQEQARRKGRDPEKTEVTRTSGAGHGLGQPFGRTPFDTPEDEGVSSPDGSGAPPKGASTSHGGGQSSAAGLTAE